MERKTAFLVVALAGVLAIAFAGCVQQEQAPSPLPVATATLHVLASPTPGSGASDFPPFPPENGGLETATQPATASPWVSSSPPGLPFESDDGSDFPFAPG